MLLLFWRLAYVFLKLCPEILRMKLKAIIIRMKPKISEERDILGNEMASAYNRNALDVADQVRDDRHITLRGMRGIVALSNRVAVDEKSFLALDGGLLNEFAL